MRSVKVLRDRLFREERREEFGRFTRKGKKEGEGETAYKEITKRIT